MRLTNEDLQFLRQVHTHLYETNQRQLSVPLAGLIGRMETMRDEQRNANKRRATKNRENGYAWNSSCHPKKSKYKKEVAGNDTDREVD